VPYVPFFRRRCLDRRSQQFINANIFQIARYRQMSLRWKVGILLVLVQLMVFSTPFFGRVQTRHFSTYAACRKVALTTKGYAVWKPQGLARRIFRSRLIFSDGFNSLDCSAIGIGPFWIVSLSQHTYNVGCTKDLGNGQTIACPEDYFGVSD
jgi:hypothetical protein